MSEVSGSVRVYAKFPWEGIEIQIFRLIKLFSKYSFFQVICRLHNSLRVLILIFCIAHIVKSISNQCVKSSCRNITYENFGVHFCIADLVKIGKSSKSFCIEPKLSPVKAICTLHDTSFDIQIQGKNDEIRHSNITFDIAKT